MQTSAETLKPFPGLASRATLNHPRDLNIYTSQFHVNKENEDNIGKKETPSKSFVSEYVYKVTGNALNRV